MSSTGLWLALAAIAVGYVLSLGCPAARLALGLEGDRARRGLIWLHPCIWSLFVSLALHMAEEAYKYGEIRHPHPAGDFRTGQGRFATAFFDLLSYVFLLLSLSSLVRGVQSIHAKDAKVPFRSSVPAALALSTTLALATFAYGIYVPTATGTAPLDERPRTARRVFSILRFVETVLTGLASVAVAAQAWKTRKAAGSGMARRVMKHLVFAAGLEAAMLSWRMAATLLMQAGRWQSDSEPWLVIRDATPGGGLHIGAVSMVYAVGAMKEGGLWSDAAVRAKVEGEESGEV